MSLHSADGVLSVSRKEFFVYKGERVMEVQIGERIVDVTLLSKEGNKVSIEVDGKVYNVDICMFANGQCSILNGGVSYNPFIVHEDGTKSYKVSLNYSEYEISMLDSQAKYMKMKKKNRREDIGDTVKAPMPSKVINLYVEPGQKVKAGETLITLEAMKMQSSIAASSDCTVLSINCGIGDNVMADQVLIVLDVAGRK